MIREAEDRRERSLTLVLSICRSTRLSRDNKSRAMAQQLRSLCNPDLSPTVYPTSGHNPRLLRNRGNGEREERWKEEERRKLGFADFIRKTTKYLLINIPWYLSLIEKETDSFGQLSVPEVHDTQRPFTYLEYAYISVLISYSTINCGSLYAHYSLAI